MSPKLVEYNAKNYPEVKSDFSMIFYKKAIDSFVKKNGYIAFITTNSWMFLKSFEKIRKQTIDGLQFESIVDFGTELFDGKVGHNPIVSWISRKSKPYKKFIGVRLVDYCYSRRDEKEPEFFNLSNRYITNQKDFEKIPGMPIAYWLNAKVINLYKEGQLFGDVALPKVGMQTANNDKYLRLWHEINFNEFQVSKRIKWIKYLKGGAYRKWYGNLEYLLFYNYSSAYILQQNNARVLNEEFLNINKCTWTDLTSAANSFRYAPKDTFYDISGHCFLPNEKDQFWLLGYANTKIFAQLLKIFNSSMHCQVGDVAKVVIPIISDKLKELITKVSKENVEISKTDWDSFETSWDFKVHPLVSLKMAGAAAWGEDKPMCRISSAFKAWEDFTEQQFAKLKANEEELNRIFIEIYGLEDELTPEVEDKDVTIRKADLGRDIRSFISYAVGCMLGRYSLDVEELAYAGGEWDQSKYTTIIPDPDNIIPITDEEYFDDDIVARLVNFVKVVYGKETLEENLDFIASALGKKGNTSREVIRNYFLKDFYKDHLKIYKKRPIYWLFNSGRANGFKALIYMHRYDEDTIGRVRTDYLHKIQAKLEDVMNQCDMVLNSEVSANEKAKAVKKKEKLIKQLAETKIYDQAIAHIALQRIAIDLDDGVKVNYAKFQNVEVSNEGKKSVKVNLLSKI